MNSFRLQIAFPAVLAMTIFAPELEAASCAANALSGAPMPSYYDGACAPELTTPLLVQKHPQSPQDLGFAVDIFGSSQDRPANRLYRFQLNDFASQVYYNPIQPGIIGMDFTTDGLQLFAVLSETAPQFPGSLGRIIGGKYDLIATISGLPPSENLDGFAIDPRTGAAYLSTHTGGKFLARLWSINLVNAAATLIGPMSAPSDPTGTVMIAIAMNCEGKLYAHNLGDKALYRVDPVTAETTFIGSHGFDTNFAQGMDFDNSDGTLYAFMTLNSRQNRFGTFNLKTGAFTTLSNNTPEGEFEGAIPTVCPEAVSLFADGFE